MYSLFFCLSLILKISVMFLKFSKVLFFMMVESCWQRLQMASGFSDSGNRQWVLNCQSTVIPRAVHESQTEGAGPLRWRYELGTVFKVKEPWYTGSPLQGTGQPLPLTV